MNGSRSWTEKTSLIGKFELTSEHGRSLAISHGVVFAPGILLDGQLFSYGSPSEKKPRRRLE